jgi:hypothetical protein
MDSASVPQQSLDIDAKVYIIDSDGNKSQPALYLGRGAYQASIGALDGNAEYGIQIEFEGEVYQSKLSKPLHTPEIDSLSWQQPQRYGPVSIRVSTHDDTDDAAFFLWNFTEDWEITVRYPTIVFFDTSTERLYEVMTEPPYRYCWKNLVGGRYFLGSTDALSQNRIVNRELYGIEADDERFEELYSVLVTQKAVSRSAFDYYQSFKESNESMGGLFTPQPNEIIGNITCITNPAKKVMGYVEILKNVTRKRLFVAKTNIQRPFISEYCGVMTPYEVETGTLSQGELYRRGYRPATSFESVEFCWALERCTDCRAKGGTLDMPDFWPRK